jgi:uncharacterized membrane protein YfhO
LTLETDLPQDKFLVYTDSYSPGWRVTLDGRPVPLYRANLAFKGLLVPSGRHKIRFFFDPPLVSVVFFLQEMIVVGVFIAGVAAFSRRKGNGAV